MYKGISSGQVNLSNGETYYYREYGHGDTILVLVHGHLSSSRHMAPMFEHFGEGYRIIAPDMRGFGNSSYNTRIDSLEELSEDIKDFCDLLGIKKAVFGGWSTGGGVLMNLAADYPDLVEKLILIESVSCKGYPVAVYDENNQITAGKCYATKEDMARDPVLVAPIMASLEHRDYEFTKSLWDGAITNVNRLDAREEKALYEETFKQRSCLDIYWALDRFNITDDATPASAGNGKVHKIKCPVLASWGDAELIIPRYMVDENIEALDVEVKLVIFENSGHYPIVDCLPRLVGEIDAFIRN